MGNVVGLAGGERQVQWWRAQKMRFYQHQLLYRGLSFSLAWNWSPDKFWRLFYDKSPHVAVEWKQVLRYLWPFSRKTCCGRIHWIWYHVVLSNAKYTLISVFILWHTLPCRLRGRWIFFPWTMLVRLGRRLHASDGACHAEHCDWGRQDRFDFPVFCSCLL